MNALPSGSSWSSAVLAACLLAPVSNHLAAQTADSRIDFSVPGCACPACTTDPLATICTSQSPNTRVVGRGLVSQGDVDNQGNLLNPQAYWQNGVVARYATLTLSGEGEGPVGETPWASFSLTINGNYVDAWTIRAPFDFLPGDVVQVDIPIEMAPVRSS